MNKQTSEEILAEGVKNLMSYGQFGKGIQTQDPDAPMLASREKERIYGRVFYQYFGEKNPSLLDTNLELVDARTGETRCKVCGLEHYCKPCGTELQERISQGRDSLIAKTREKIHEMVERFSRAGIPKDQLQSLLDEIIAEHTAVAT